MNDLTLNKPYLGPIPSDYTDEPLTPGKTIALNVYGRLIKDLTEYYQYRLDEERAEEDYWKNRDV